MDVGFVDSIDIDGAALAQDAYRRIHLMSPEEHIQHSHSVNAQEVQVPATDWI
jgi:hypothetical protein